MTVFHPILVREHIRQTTMQTTRSNRFFKRRKADIMRDKLRAYGMELLSLLGLVAMIVVYAAVAMWITSPIAP